MASETQPEPAVEPAVENPRLTIVLNQRGDATLNKIKDQQGLNKTTVVHRALQVYELLIDTVADGGEVLLSVPGKELTKVVLL